MPYPEQVSTISEQFYNICRENNHQWTKIKILKRNKKTNQSIKQVKVDQDIQINQSNVNKALKSINRPSVQSIKKSNMQPIKQSTSVLNKQSNKFLPYDEQNVRAYWLISCWWAWGTIRGDQGKHCCPPYGGQDWWRLY